jgi:hypothetical protein
MKAVCRLLILFGTALLLFGFARWAAPVHGLSGRYFLDENRTGPVVNTSLDERIAFGRRDFVQRAGRSDHVGIVWEGYVRLARAETFRFTLRSDDGSWLHIDDRLVIDNGGIHAVGQFDVDVPLSAGPHKLRVEYFNAEEDGRIELSWRRKGVFGFLRPLPSFTPGPIDARTAALDWALNIAARILALVLIALGAVLVRAAIVRSGKIAEGMRLQAGGIRDDVRRSARANPFAIAARAAGSVAVPILLLAVLGALRPVRGLSAAYFANASWEGKPLLTAVDRSVHFEKSALVRRAAGLDGPASAAWEGILSVPAQSAYRFELVSDDGSLLELDGRLLIDNGGYHPSRRAVREILLARGDHPIRINYFDAGDGGHIDAFIRRTGGLWPGVLSAVRLYPAPPGPALRAVENGLMALKLVLIVALIVAGILFGIGIKPVLGALPGRVAPLSRAIRLGSDKAGRYLGRRTVALLVLFAAAWALIAGVRALLPIHGLTAKYYPGSTSSSAVVLETLAPVINFDQADLRARIGGSGPVTIVYDGYLLAPKTSAYRFSVETGEAAAVVIDEHTVVEAGTGARRRSAMAGIRLDRGPHRVRILYTAPSGTGSLDFSWTETRTPRWLMPPLRLYPVRPGKGIVLGEVALPALLAISKLVRFIAGILIALLALGAALSNRKVSTFVPLALIVAAGVIYFGQVLERRSTSVEGCDTYAYLQGAEIIAREGPFRTGYTDPLIPAIHAGLSVRPQPDKEMFVLSPHGYYVQDLARGTVVNTFPPGMSMLLAPFVLVLGRGAAFWFLPFLSLLLLAAYFLLGSKAVNPTFGLGLAAAALFNEPVFGNTVLIMSDLPSLALVSLSAYGLYRNVRRPRRIWPVLAGAAFGISLVVRYSNIAAAVPLALILWIGRPRERRGRGVFRDGALFSAAAVLIGLVPLGVYTRLLFGTPFRLVYDPVNVSRMSLANLAIGTSFYLGSLWRTFGPVGAVLTSIGLVSGLARKSCRAAALVGLSGFSAFFVFYAFQSIRHERYLIPAYPFLALLFAFGLLEAARAVRRSRILVALALAAAVAFPLARSFGPAAVGFRGADIVAAEAKARVSDAPVVFCDQMSGPLRLYAGIPGYRFSWTDPDVLADILAALERERRTIYFLLDNNVAEDRFRALLAAVPGLAGRLFREPDVGKMPFYRWASKRGEAGLIKIEHTP